jgi:c-di-GMP-binding flagellar brake protein YcgR
MLQGKDNRVFFRSISDLEVWYCQEDSEDFKKATTKDFSATGLSFISPSKPPVGDRIKIKLHLKDTDTVINTSAFVIRNSTENEQNITSIQFFDIDYHDFIKLLDYSLIFHI